MDGLPTSSTLVMDAEPPLDTILKDFVTRSEAHPVYIAGGKQGQVYKLTAQDQEDVAVVNEVARAGQVFGINKDGRQMAVKISHALPVDSQDCRYMRTTQIGCISVWSMMGVTPVEEQLVGCYTTPTGYYNSLVTYTDLTTPCADWPAVLPQGRCGSFSIVAEKDGHCAGICFAIDSMVRRWIVLPQVVATAVAISVAGVLVINEVWENNLKVVAFLLKGSYAPKSIPKVSEKKSNGSKWDRAAIVRVLRWLACEYALMGLGLVYLMSLAPWPIQYTYEVYVGTNLHMTERLNNQIDQMYGWSRKRSVEMCDTLRRPTRFTYASGQTTTVLQALLQAYLFGAGLHAMAQMQKKLYDFVDPDAYMDPDNDEVSYKDIHEYRHKVYTTDMLLDWQFVNLTVRVAEVCLGTEAFQGALSKAFLKDDTKEREELQAAINRIQQKWIKAKDEHGEGDPLFYSPYKGDEEITKHTDLLPQGTTAARMPENVARGGVCEGSNSSEAALI